MLHRVLALLTVATFLFPASALAAASTPPNPLKAAPCRIGPTQAVLIGRAYAYGLGAAGGPGVAKAIQILRSDIARTLRLLGCPDVANLDPTYLRYCERAS